MMLLWTLNYIPAQLLEIGFVFIFPRRRLPLTEGGMPPLGHCSLDSTGDVWSQGHFSQMLLPDLYQAERNGAGGDRQPCRVGGLPWPSQAAQCNKSVGSHFADFCYDYRVAQKLKGRS